jgi:hypothetical protein
MQNQKKVPQYKEAPFMNVLRNRVFIKYPKSDIKYGDWTTPKRKKLGLNKEHYNDALVISGIETGFVNNAEVFILKQFRKKKRSLHEATPRKGGKMLNRTAKRNKKNTKCSNGFFLNDKVSFFGEIGWIRGFSVYGAYIKNSNDNFILTPNKKYKYIRFKDLKVINHNNNWQWITHPSSMQKSD